MITYRSDSIKKLFQKINYHCNLVRFLLHSKFKNCKHSKLENSFENVYGQNSQIVTWSQVPKSI